MCRLRMSGSLNLRFNGPGEVVREALYFDYVKTRLGTFRLAASERGLTAIQFPGQFAFQKKSNGKTPESARKALQAGNRFLKRYFSGKMSQNFNIPMDWQKLSPFETRVLKALRKVPPSSVTDYSTLARISGVPNGARAVGNALGRNPFPVLIPCHRVVHKDRSLGGFSSGLNWKRKLLSLEKNGLGVKKKH